MTADTIDPPTEAEIATVDNLPRPRRPELSIATIERVVTRATREAMRAARRLPESAPGVFAQHVDPMAALDSTAQDPATWTRIGAVLGAKAAWAGNLFMFVPPDCPRGACVRCYNAAYSFAAMTVDEIRREVGNG